MLIFEFVEIEDTVYDENGLGALSVCRRGFHGETGLRNRARP